MSIVPAYADGADDSDEEFLRSICIAARPTKDSQTSSASALSQTRGNLGNSSDLDDEFARSLCRQDRTRPDQWHPNRHEYGPLLAALDALDGPVRLGAAVPALAVQATPEPFPSWVGRLSPPVGWTLVAPGGGASATMAASAAVSQGAVGGSEFSPRSWLPEELLTRQRSTLEGLRTVTMITVRKLRIAVLYNALSYSSKSCEDALRRIVTEVHARCYFYVGTSVDPCRRWRGDQLDDRPYIHDDGKRLHREPMIGHCKKYSVMYLLAVVPHNIAQALEPYLIILGKQIAPDRSENIAHDARGMARGPNVLYCCCRMV